MDETGAVRPTSVLSDLFAFDSTPTTRVNRYGAGLAIYRDDIVGSNLFGDVLDPDVEADTLSAIEQLVRIHVDEAFLLEDNNGLYADRAVVDDLNHNMYLVNYSGLQMPLVQSVRDIAIHYQAPAGKRVSSVLASSPDSDGLNGFAAITDGKVLIELPIDQFALLQISLEDAVTATFDPYPGPQFDDPAHAEAARSGLDFVLNSMRNPVLPEPYNFGVHTNLLDNTDSTAVYTNGHHVTTMIAKLGSMLMRRWMIFEPFTALSMDMKISIAQKLMRSRTRYLKVSIGQP